MDILRNSCREESGLELLISGITACLRHCVLFKKQVTITRENLEGLQLLADRLQIAEITRVCVAYVVAMMEEDPGLAIEM